MGPSGLLTIIRPGKTVESQPVDFVPEPEEMAALVGGSPFFAEVKYRGRDGLVFMAEESMRAADRSNRVASHFCGIDIFGVAVVMTALGESS